MFKKCKELHPQFKADIISSDDKLIHFLRVLVETYKQNKTSMIPLEKIDTFLYVLSLKRANYIDSDQFETMGKAFVMEDGHLTEGFRKFNKSIIKKYGNGVKN